jgi:beta-phosphoglucomutase-like phosphatase (HAD superfamily)
MLSGIGYDEWFGKDPAWASHTRPLKPDDCIVFEDSPSGARAGVAAGAFVVGILSGQKEATLKEAGCSMIIHDFQDERLWKHLDQISISDRNSKTSSSQ